MKNTLAFVIWICVLLSCEILATWYTDGGIRAFETFISRGSVTLALAVWYYYSQDPKVTTFRGNFFFTLLIPLMIGFSRYLLPDPASIKLIAFLNFASYVLWIIQFKKLGAEFNISKFPLIYFIFIPVIFSIPFLYYFLVLFPLIQDSNMILVFLFALFIAITSVIVLFLPITKDFSGRYFIIFGIWLTEFTHMMQSYYHYNNEGLFIYPFARIIQTSSFIFLLVGMTTYCKSNSRIIIQN